MTHQRIYLDNNASTALDAKALEAMLPYFMECYGHPRSMHVAGFEAAGAMDHATDRLLHFLGASDHDVRFNSGATEGIDQLIQTLFERNPRKRHFVTTRVEHPATLQAMDNIKRKGAKLSFIGVDADGRLDLEALDTAIRPDTALVSVTAANHETGVIFPLDVIAEKVKAKGAQLHVDATQALGRLPLSLDGMPVDFLTLSAHKFHGPKGLGALICRRGSNFKAIHLKGTENVPAVVGMAAACEAAQNAWPEMDRIAQLKHSFEKQLKAVFPKAVIQGARSQRLPNTTLVSFPEQDGEAMALSLSEQGICVSTGGACSSGNGRPSHVLEAMGVASDLSKGTLRISLSRLSQAEDLDALMEVLKTFVS